MAAQRRVVEARPIATHRRHPRQVIYQRSTARIIPPLAVFLNVVNEEENMMSRLRGRYQLCLSLSPSLESIDACSCLCVVGRTDFSNKEASFRLDRIV